MTLYGRSDLAAVTVSEAHGGCTRTHHRPANDGNPAKVWKLDCPACEDHLRHDPHWSATLSEIPETHDEQKSREDYTKRGANDVQTMLALALARMTGGEIPDTVAAMITGNKQHIPGLTAAKMLCPDGHENAPGSKFCSECGATMHQGAPAAALEAATNGNGHDPEGWQPPRDAHGRKKPMRDWRREDLQAYAHQLGVDPGGIRDELIERLQAAKKEAAGITG